jgi:hypothetical protein
MSKMTASLPAFLILGALLAAGCGGGEGGPTSASPPSKSASGAAESSAPSLGAKAPTEAAPSADPEPPKGRVREANKEGPALERIRRLISPEGAGGKKRRMVEAELEKLIAGARKSGARVVLHGASGGGGVARILRGLRHESK